MDKESEQAWNLDLQYFPFVARSSHVFDHISVRMQLQWVLSYRRIQPVPSGLKGNEPALSVREY